MIKKLLKRMEWADLSGKLNKREIAIDVIAIIFLIAVLYGFFVSET